MKEFKFQEILNELGVSEEFYKELDRVEPYRESIIEFLNREETFGSAIQGAFEWDTTDKGFQFWSDVADYKPQN